MMELRDDIFVHEFRYKKLKAESDRRLALLKICDENYYCPVCRGSKHYEGHREDCKLAKELA